MTPPTIQGLGVTQEWFGTSWKARGYVEGVGWLTAWARAWWPRWRRCGCWPRRGLILRSCSQEEMLMYKMFLALVIALAVEGCASPRPVVPIALLAELSASTSL